MHVLNTNVDRKHKIMIRDYLHQGHFADIVYKKADVDMNKRVGELSTTELDNLMTIMANPPPPPVVYKDGYCGVSMFIISNLLSSFPFLVALTLIIWGNLDQMIESLMIVVASLVPNFLMGIITFEHPDDDLGFLPLATRSSQAVWDTNKPLQVVGLGYYSHVIFDTIGVFVCVDKDLWLLKKRHSGEEKEGNDTH
ncbi:hypothetical protein DVH24_008394 [Malus domestica]|uniref:Uncharacterized protein n=1 Tax=Malus domestica TaxID=3750 RepID=A0A498JPW1_MALDO|nr:hypothetical protein DVH24_008394 [Malus domestica]